MTGEIFRNDTSGATIIRIASQNRDTKLLRVVSGEYPTSDTAGYGFTFLYRGTGSDNNNTFEILSDNKSSSSQVQAVKVYQDGSINIGKSLSVGDITVSLSNHTHDLSVLINNLGVGTSIPTDNDYVVCQYVGGGTTTTSYWRRPWSAVSTYMINKSYNISGSKPSGPKFWFNTGTRV